jgi:hypothetical protein
MPHRTINDNAAVRLHLSSLLTARRARQFYGVHVGAPYSFGDASDNSHYYVENFGKGNMKSLYLQTFHAALAAQRAAWSSFQTLQMMLEEDFKQELGDEATAYFGMLAADPPGGSIENITHEHVAHLLTLLKDNAPPKLSSTNNQPI